MTTTLSPDLSVGNLTHMPNSFDEPPHREFTSLTPPAHIHSNLLETWDAFYLQMAVPGIDISTVNIQTVARKVVIQGKYRIAAVEGAHYLRRDLPTGDAYGSFQLPDEVDGDRAEASDREGVLTVRLPKVAYLRRASIPIHTD